MLDSGLGLVFWAGVLAAAIWDLRVRRVPNALNLSLALLGLAAGFARSGLWGLGQAALGLGAGFVLILLPFALRLYRGGDAKLVMAMGAWLGPVGIGWAFLIGMVAGGVLGVLMAVFSGREARREIRQSLEAAVVTVTLPQVDKQRPQHRHVPMALAFGLGAFAALWRLG